MDTIYALASARGRAGIAVIRVSGPAAHEAVRHLAGRLPEPRRAALRRLVRPDGSALDDALVVVFARGASFTGEEIAELHLHGSIATVNAVLEALSASDGLRLAEPGEFTRRALENDRLDLAQVEGLADLIDAETEAQRRQALRVLSGALGGRAELWRSQLIRAAALLEATIDFADEEVPVDVGPEVLELLGRVEADLAREESGAQAAERIRDGFEVAIVGPPNIGKSTLLNVLAGREAAITSDVAGTTRDIIEVRMDLCGLPVTVLDTAGLREGGDRVETIGVSRAIDRAKASDIRVFLVSSRDETLLLAPEPDDIVAIGKCDLGTGGGFGVSATTGAGIDELVQRITDVLSRRAAGAATITRERHRLAIRRARALLQSAQGEVLNSPDRAEIAAEDLRGAIRALDGLVGRVDVEHLLDEIFASFCLGK